MKNITMSGRRSFLRSTSILSLLTLVSRVLGLLREMTKAALLGTRAISDAFSVAFVLPNLFRRLFAEGSISVAFIPTFKEYLLRDDNKEILDFLSCFWTFLTFFVSIAVALGILAAPFIVPIFGVREFDETVFLTRLMFPFLLFISIAALFQGILNSVHVFAPSAFAPIVLNAVTIAAAWLLKDYVKNPARALAIGIFVGGFLEAAIQVPFILKKGFKFSFVPLKKAIRNPGTRKILRLVVPTILGMAAYQLNDLVSTALAGNAGVGVLSSLNYSLRLQELILGVFAVSIGTVLLPELAEQAKRQEWAAFNKNLSGSISIIAMITIPVIAFSLLEGESLIRLLFETREFDENSVALTLNAFVFHISGLFFIALNRILSPAFYAQSDTASPTIAGVVSFGVNIVLALALTPFMKGGGIALALSLAGFVNTVILFIFFKRNKNIELNKIMKTGVLSILKISAISLIAAIPLFIVSPELHKFAASFQIHNRLWNYALPLLIDFIIFAGIGFLLLKFTGTLRSILRAGPK